MKKKTMMLICSALALVMIIGVWAYYSSTTALENKLKTSEYGNETEEKFTPNQNWQPGEVVTKETNVRNTGDYDLFVRIKMNEDWSRTPGGSFIGHASSDAAFLTATAGSATQANGATGLTDGKTTGDESVVFKKITTSTDWVFNAADGYWYYNKKLAAGASTVNLLESITLAGNTDMGKYTLVNYYTKAATKPDYDDISSDPGDVDTMWVVYTGSVPEGATYSRGVSTLSADAGYAGADYTLTITTETLQGTKEAFDATSSWSTTPPAVKGAWGL